MSRQDTSGAGAAVVVRGLRKSYPGRGRGGAPVTALAGIDLTVPRGTVFGLLGPNGAGKSTTVRILTTLARADGGQAQVAGFDVHRQPARVRASIGLVTQRSGCVPDETGRENLRLQGRLHGMAGARLTRRVDELLDRFDLGTAADRLARTYSGGMLRRLDVAVGLVQRPSVLFLDEPTTGLDPQARTMMWREIAQLTADGLTVVLTTHYLEEADRLAARIAIIRDGRLVVEGSPEALRGELRGDTVELELAAPDQPGGLDRLDQAGGLDRADQAGGLDRADEHGWPGQAGRTDGPAADVRARLCAVPGVDEVTIDGARIRSRVTGGAATLPAIIATLGSAGLTVASATIARPSLDDVYLRHVGERLNETVGTALDSAREDVR